MIRRRTFLGAVAALSLPAVARGQAPASGREPPYFADRLRAAALPDITERLPKQPRIINMAEKGRKAGIYGGDLRMLVGSQRETRLMTINGYARLVGYDEKLALTADILESFEAADEKSFTFKIREGHRWSNGDYLTADDFHYAWNAVIMNEDLRRGGLPRELLADGKPPVFEVLDTYTVRFTWPSPNPDFLPKLAAPQPIVVVMPSKYLKQFHKDFQDENRLAALVKQYRAKHWRDLHTKMARSYRPENPDLPTLDPWRNTTPPPAEQFVFERNPFFHRIDENGLQLPYIDRVMLNVSSSQIIPAKAGAGESDLQFNGLDFTDYAFLKDSESRYPVKVSLWTKTQGSLIALLPNLNSEDEVWRKLFRDVRLRRALSVAIDRSEINKAVFYSLAAESADAILPESPLFKPHYKTAWAQHDPELANSLLDEVGLVNRDDDGYRLLPDGRKAQIIVETAGESTLETDVLELVTDYWQRIGISLFIKTSQRDIFRNRAMAGQIMVSVWAGLDNGVPTADMNPGMLAPTADEQLQWPLWGMHYLSNGQKGKAPDLPEAVELVELLEQWKKTPDMPGRAAIWTRMLELYSDQVFSIGIVNASRQPMLRSSRLVNMPETALYGFDPTCYLGVYMPDTFWLSKEG
jgi:peptide/nickel transport system substrate-binding protein